MTDPKSSKRESFWRQLPVQSIYPQTYLNIAQERGGNIERIFARSSFPQEILQRQNAEINFLQMHDLVQCVLDEVGNDGIGIEVGLRLPPTAFGNLGYAILCSATMQDAVALCARYWYLLGRGLSISQQHTDPFYIIDLTPTVPFPKPMTHLVFESTMASFYRGFQVLVDCTDDDMEIWFAAPRPDYADKVEAKIGCVHYGMPANQFRFRSELLSRSLAMHNPIGLKFALEQCAREEAMIEKSSFKLREKVQQQMVFGREGYPTLQDMSNQLNMTSRTLRRRLESEGTNFKNLLEEAKRRDAIQLLDDDKMEIQQIATLLGYQDPANFTRAFRQWTGQTPSQYRTTRDQSRL
ncbi:MAG: AraC family transcriptional regulator [Pseudomonadales bacterium]|uniref:AraC family transcriptional regulator n=1 Tax=Oleiphilus messinensis TaxID=141451 RepID=A0A1Y0I1Q2_9GAMM|nr:AraC family transcriptional regulator [Oleiphilus messinensis]ARU54331.1 AraC family transcriptional regulator [Oleiphilus messinensis]MCG8610296.1 AraC family transcriptional regulator [Pseudomonadales bacterium]